MKNKKLLMLSALSLSTMFVSCGGDTTPSEDNLTSSEEVLSSEQESKDIYLETEELVSSEEEKVLPNKKLFVLGDSTACSFSDTTYYYPRYGFGTQFEEFFDSSLEVVNLALSGRSSKSFLAESNYSSFKNNISEGDYVLIAFGHNDEKSDDVTRFTDARLETSDSSSFKYSLYENYIKVAESKGAIPILATPIVRLSTSDDYSGSNGHNTETGDYSKAIRDLSVEKGIEVVDLTSSTKSLYSDLGYDGAQWFHAMTSGKKDDAGNVVANTSSIDKTHLNVYGAKMVAYMFACDLKNTDSSLKEYVNSTLIEPNKDTDLVANPSYVYSDYTAPNLEGYNPVNQYITTSEGWYGTAFGDTGGDPTSTSNGYVAKEENGIFTVGQNIDGTSYKGKISSSSEGFAYLFRQVSASKNFSLTVDVKVVNELDQKQAAFGLMIRDDCYLPTRDSALKGNSISSALLCDTDFMNVFFSRSNGTLSKGSDKVTGLYQEGDTAVISIVRLGQKVTTSLTYKDVTYTKDYLDFPLQEKDQDNMYIGMFATRGTVIECTNVNFEITGDAIQA